MTPAVTEFKTEELAADLTNQASLRMTLGEYEAPSWSISNFGGVLHVDDYENMPQETIASIDIETNGKEVTDEDFKIVCIGICGNGVDAHVYFDIRPELIRYLQSVQIIAHDGKRAEIPWLESYGVKIDQLYFDTKTGFYNYDSTRKNYSLKPILKDVLGVEYPTYSEIIGDAEFIRAACDMDRSLFITKRLKPTKKVPEGVLQEKLPKEVLLDRMPKWITAEYNACDIFWTFKLWVWLRQHYTGSQKKFFRHVEMPETQLIYHMERKGIKIDTRLVRKIHNEHSKARRVAKKRIFELAGSTFNINSPKHQLLPVLQAHVSPSIESTGEEALQSYRGQPLVDALFEYRGHQKLCSTYTIPLYSNAVKDEQNRIRARFNQNTITGRLSSSDPINLQNQPQDVRGCFIAEDGFGFINADWSNIELRLPAHLSGEPKFLAELSRPDGDLHVCTANFIYRCDIRSLPGAEYDKRRNTAKTCNFLLTNSGTAERLAVELKCSVQEAKEIFRLFWEGYPVLGAWLANEKRQARVLGGIGTWFGRWVNIPQLRLSCFQPWKCGKVDPGSGRTVNCKNCIVRQEAERSAMSIRVQGTAADMCKMAAIRLWREYGLVPNLKVHDEMNYEELLVDVPQAAERIKYVMENVTALKVPLVADIGVGFSWKEAKKSCTSLTGDCLKKKCLRHKTGV